MVGTTAFPLRAWRTSLGCASSVYGMSHVYCDDGQSCVEGAKH